LKEQITEHNEDLEELDLLVKDLKEPRGAKLLRARVNKMLKKADTLLRKLEEDRKAISNIPESIAEEDKKKEREKLMRVEDLINKLQKVQNMSEKNQEEFRKILQALDDDNDGVIDADLVLRALDLFGSHKDLRLTTEQIKTIVEMLKKEEQVEAMQAFISGTVPYPPIEDKKIPSTDFSADLTRTVEQKLKDLPPLKPEDLPPPGLGPKKQPPNEKCI
uniref:EF-hand domain-containing protein n=1 Tax=Gongylonema pulchrum TaxID=637853 RepID=A0A183EMQ6_9BILA